MRRPNLFTDNDPRVLPRSSARGGPRRGVFTPLAVVSLFAVLAFVALGVDVGLISLTRARMQFATDAAALAAVHELSDTVAEGDDPSALDGEMASRARAMAEKVAGMNDTFVDAELDVRLGRRVYDDQAGRYRIQWVQRRITWWRSRPGRITRTPPPRTGRCRRSSAGSSG